MIIGIDLDCVLNNMDEEWLKRYNADYQDNLQLADLTKWGIHDLVKKSCGRKIYDYLQDPSFFTSLKPKEGSFDVLKRLCQQQMNEVYIVTASDASVIEAKVKWIKEHFSFFDEDRIVMLKHKWRMDLDMLIDDGLHNFGMNHKYWFVFNKAHNANFKCCNKISFRVNDWNEIDLLLKGIEP